MQQTFVIVGAGQVAATAVESLRREGYGGRLVVVGDEPELPYQRPPLSKKYLAGELPHERLTIKPASFYEHAQAELVLGTRATRLDAAARAETAHERAGLDAHAGPRVLRGEERRHAGCDDAVHDALGHLEHEYLVAKRAAGRCDLESDVAAADHDHAPPRCGELGTYAG